MSLDYIITSPAVIDGTTSSNLSLEFGGDSINLSTPSSLLNTYDIVLPSNIGLQNQVLTLNSSLETIWADNTSTGTINDFSMSSNITFSNSAIGIFTIPDTSITPPAGTYYCHFTSSYNATSTNAVGFGIYVDGNLIILSRRGDFAGFFNNGINVFSIVTVNGSENIDVRSSTSTSGVDVFERVFIVNKIA